MKLIVTGDLERLALAAALARCFPRERDGADVYWEAPQKVNEVSTHRLKPLGPDITPDTAMRTLARAVLGATLSGKMKGSLPADLVVAICDVEVGNLDQEAVVVAHLRRALELEVDSYELNTRDRYRRVLRERCSFHLLRPMVEALFFGDRAALNAAGVSAHQDALLKSPDVEEFECLDTQWLPQCHEENQKRTPPGWWRHERHPKHYLEHLTLRSSVNYDETREGRKALDALNWRNVPSDPTAAAYLRSLFEDLAEWFGIPNPLAPGVVSPVTSLSPASRDQNRWLRNL